MKSMIPAKLKLPTAYVDLDMMIFGLGRKTVFKKCYGINPKLVPELARFYKEGIRFTHDYLLRLAKEPGAVWAQTLLKLEEQFVKPSETSGSFIVSMYPLGKGRHVLDAFDKEREQKPCLPVVPPPPMAEILVGRYFSHYFEGTSLSTEKIEQLELVARGDRDLPMEFVGLREEAIERFQGLSPLPQMLIKAIKLYEILIEDERDVQSLNSAENVRRLAKKRSSAIFSLINKPEYLAEPETGEFLIQLIKDEVDSVYIITLAVFGLRKIFDLGTEHPLWLTLKEEFLQMAVRLESSETERYGAVAALESLSEKSDREIAVFISATEDVYLVREKAVLALTSLPESQKSGPVFAALIKLAGCEQRTRIYDMMQRQFVEWLKAGREMSPPT